jgi:hypothetical protein
MNYLGALVAPEWVWFESVSHPRVQFDAFALPKGFYLKLQTIGAIGRVYSAS